MFFVVAPAGVHVPRLRARRRRALRQRQRRDVRDGLDGGVRRGHGDHAASPGARRPSRRWAGAASSALTPLRPLAFVAAKTGVAMVVAAVPVALIYAIGAATGARGNASDWLRQAAVVWLGSALFAVYGLAVCLVFRASNAAGIASGMIVIMASSATSSRRWSGIILDIGRFTPLYGYAALARYPITEGYLPMGRTRPAVAAGR